MSFESIKPDLASWPTPRVTLVRPPHIHHHPSRMRRRIRSVLPLSSRTRCLTSHLVLRPTGMRPRSTASSSAMMWRPSELICARSWPTRRPSSVINSLSNTSSPRFSPSSNLHRRLCSDRAYPQGSFYTLSCSFIDIGDNVLTCLGGCDRVW